MERDGALVFKNRTGRAAIALSVDQIALLAEQDTALEFAREPDAETLGRLRLGFVGAEADYDVEFEEAVFPDGSGDNVSQSSVPLILTRQEARAIVERWLAEARIARDAVKFSLPPSQMHLGAGDIVGLPDADGMGQFRVDHVTHGEAQMVTAVRIEPEVYLPGEHEDAPTLLRPFSPPVPVSAMFLDVPLITGAEIAHAPHLAVVADPWPGGVAVYASADDAGYQLQDVISTSAVTGVTQTALDPAFPSSWDRGPALQVVVAGGDLASATQDAVLNGANVAAIGDHATGVWEIIQFSDATLVAPDTYDLSLRLRGQFGTDALGQSGWPAGSDFVLLDGGPVQVDLGAATRGLARHYRIGPEDRGYSDPSFTHVVAAFDGVGLRPYAPAHLKAVSDAGGDVHVSWVRRTRIDGDSWQSLDVPLGEDFESYLIRVWDGATLVREDFSTTATWLYDAAMITADGVSGSIEIAVAQVSAQFGAGLFRKVQINV